MFESLIKKADAIAETLNIDFPQSAEDFNVFCYAQFVSYYWNEYTQALEFNRQAEENEYFLSLLKGETYG